MSTKKPGNPGFGTVWKAEASGPETMDTPLNLRVSKRQKEKLREMAESSGMDISRFIRQLIDSLPA